MNNPIKDSWNLDASGEIEGWYHPADPERHAVAARLMENPRLAFPMAVYPLIEKYMGDLRGKKVCVPSSGDNIAAFGFHLLGAEVTSCDIAENMLRNAKLIADRHGWAIEFVCQDSMKLEAIPSGAYDLVYTSNGAHVWIDDLPGMYSNFHRILKPGGYSIFFDTHPMGRPFGNDRADTVKIVKPYEEIFRPDDSGVPRWLWRTQDIVNAVVEAGFTLRHMEEFHSVPADVTGNYLEPEEDPAHPNYGKNLYDWHENPWAALPQCLCLCSRK